jgi:hypothetical protein
MLSSLDARWPGPSTAATSKHGPLTPERSLGGSEQRPDMRRSARAELSGCGAFSCGNV